MNRRLVRLAILPIVCLALSCASTPYGPSPSPHATSSVRVDVAFYDALSPYGDWYWIDVEGWIWVPADVPAGWRPYTHGTWVYSTWGWTWVSEWSWGWAPFHYGRWLRHPRYGWAWVPGYVWAPAWVTWRLGDGWVGWAPLPPRARWDQANGRLLGDVRVHVDWWTFVPDHRMGDLHVRRYAVPDPDRATLFERTRQVTRFEAVDGRTVRERGLEPAALERSAGIAIPRYRLEDTHRPSAVDTRPGDGRVAVYRPEVRDPGPARPEKGRTARRKPAGPPH